MFEDNEAKRLDARAEKHFLTMLAHSALSSQQLLFYRKRDLHELLRRIRGTSPEPQEVEQMLGEPEAIIELTMETIGRLMQSVRTLRSQEVRTTEHSAPEKYAAPEIPSRVEVEDGMPVMRCEVTADGTHWVFQCPACGEHHYHGAFGGEGHRASHCRQSSLFPNGYLLRLR